MACKLEESPLCSNDNLVWKDAANVISSVNPWNKVKNGDLLKEQSTLSFEDIMSEDLARDLHERKETNTNSQFFSEEANRCDSQFFSDEANCYSPFFSEEANCNASPEDFSYLTDFDASPEDFSYLADFDEENVVDTSNDLMLALMLQENYNKEHDDQIQREEKHFNKNSSVSVSFSKYKMCPEYHQEFDCDEKYKNLEDENRAIDKFEESKRTEPVIPACGYTRHNNKIVTKHDAALSGRRNAERIMSLHPSLNTGDGGGYDFHIDNKVYNRLRQSTAKKDERRRDRFKDKQDTATDQKALDLQTRIVLFKLVRNGVLEKLNQIVSMGKESVVFHANGGTLQQEKLPAECAIKIFKTTLTDFKTREKYIRNDFRFKDRMAKNNTRQTINLWTEKEFDNLRRLHKANIPCPKPILVKEYILVMSLIGDGSVAAPKLRYAELTPKQWNLAYHQVVEIMTKMYRTCNLIHGDLSEYNILWYREMCWVIDLGQAVEPIHPNALQFFYRDCSNIVGFFRSKGLTNISSPFELFQNVTGINFDGEEEDAERLIENYERNQEMWHEGKIEEGDNFDFLWNEVKDLRALEGDLLIEIPDEESSSGEQEIIFEDRVAIEGGKKRNRRRKKKRNVALIATKSNQVATI